MAISTTGSQALYSGTNVANQVCPFPYVFFTNSDLVVETLSSTNVLTTLVLGTNYSVSGANSAIGGSVTIFLPVPTTTKISITRNLPETQLVSFTTGDRFPASIMERALDRLTMLVQEVMRGVTKSLRMADVGANQPPLLPIASSVLTTNSANEIKFTSSASATGASPYFLVANTAGGTPQFVPLPTITDTRIGTGAVTTTKIADANVTTAKIADANVTTTKIADANVTTAKIADNAVTGAKIADANVTTAKIADANVTPAKIGGNPATDQYILGSSAGIVSWQLPSTTTLQDGAVTTAKLATDAVTTTKIADANVTTAKIADANVTTAKIADANVTTAKIADANVTTAKIADANVTTAKIADNAVTGAKIADANVTTAKIADANVTTAKIADANVTTAKIADNAVTGAKIADSAITFRELATGTPIQLQTSLISGRVATNLQLVSAANGYSVAPLATTGLQIVSLSFTKKISSSKLLIRFQGNFSAAPVMHFGCALFAGTTLLCSVRAYAPVAAAQVVVPLEFWYTTTAMTAVAYTIRIYKLNEAITANYLRLNGYTSNEFGNTLKSSISITEIK
jgi:uncharacterized protein YjbI with pentapeptide repeats